MLLAEKIEISIYKILTIVFGILSLSSTWMFLNFNIFGPGSKFIKKFSYNFQASVRFYNFKVWYFLLSIPYRLCCTIFE